MKNYLSWSLFDLEKAIEKEEFIDFLKYSKDKYSESKVLEILKASGYFISVGKMKERNKEVKNVLSKYFDRHFSNGFYDKYRSLIREAEILKQKRKELENEIDVILENNYIVMDDLLEKVVEKLSILDNEAVKGYLFTVNKEYLIFSLGNILKSLLYIENEESKNKPKISKENLELLLQHFFVLREFNELILSWMYGNVEITLDEIGITIKKMKVIA